MFTNTLNQTHNKNKFNNLSYINSPELETEKNNYYSKRNNHREMKKK